MGRLVCQTLADGWVERRSDHARNGHRAFLRAQMVLRPVQPAVRRGHVPRHPPPSATHPDDPCLRCKARAAMVVLRTAYVLYHRCTLCVALWSTRRPSESRGDSRPRNRAELQTAQQGFQHRQHAVRWSKAGSCRARPPGGGPRRRWSIDYSAATATATSRTRVERDEG